LLSTELSFAEWLVPMPASSPQSTTIDALRRRAKELLALARDPSDTARGELVSGLYDLSHAIADPSPEGGAAAVDLVLEIIKRASVNVRQLLAERLARDPAAPKHLVMTLARDQIAVAYPILLESPVIEEAELLAILREKPPEFQLTTLQREDVSETLSAAAVESGDPRRMRWLVENPGAAIARKTMERLVEAARAEPALQKPLVGRVDLPEDLAVTMSAFVPEALRQKLVERHRIDPKTLPQAPSPTLAASAEPAPLDMKKWLRGVPQEDLNFELLLNTIRAGKAAEFEALLARFSRISMAAAHQIMRSATGEGLAVALKAAGVDRGAFATVYILCRKARAASSASSSALTRAIEIFDRMKAEEAKKRLGALRQAHPEDWAA
jgi:uncharacterized protein (DUF2336 family)